MEKIGVGDYQSHVAHWLENRIRNLKKDVQVQGGSIACQDIEARLCDHIRSGVVDGLSYDEASGRVHLALPSASPPPTQALPPVPVMEASRYTYSYPAARVIGWQVPFGPCVQRSRFLQVGKPGGYEAGAGATTIPAHLSPNMVAPNTPAVGGGVRTAGWILNPAIYLRGGVNTSGGRISPPQLVSKPYELISGQPSVADVVPNEDFENDKITPAILPQGVLQTVSVSRGLAHVANGTTPSTSSTSAQPTDRDSNKDQAVLDILKPKNSHVVDGYAFGVERNVGNNYIQAEQCCSKQYPGEFLPLCWTQVKQSEQNTGKESVGHPEIPLAPPPLQLPPPQALPPAEMPRGASRTESAASPHSSQGVTRVAQAGKSDATVYTDATTTESKEEMIHEFELWARAPGAPGPVVAVQEEFEKAGSKSRYIHQAERLLLERRCKKYMEHPSSEAKVDQSKVTTDGDGDGGQDGPIKSAPEVTANLESSQPKKSKPWKMYDFVFTELKKGRHGEPGAAKESYPGLPCNGTPDKETNAAGPGIAGTDKSMRRTDDNDNELGEGGGVGWGRGGGGRDGRGSAAKLNLRPSDFAEGFLRTNCYGLPSTKIQANSSVVGDRENMNPAGSENRLAVKAAVNGNTAHKPSRSPLVPFEIVRPVDGANPAPAIAFGQGFHTAPTWIAPAPIPAIFTQWKIIDSNRPAKGSDASPVAVHVVVEHNVAAEQPSASSKAARVEWKDASPEEVDSTGMPQAGVTMTSGPSNTDANSSGPSSETARSHSSGRRTTGYFHINDEPSMREAAAALGITIDEKDAGHLGKIFSEAGPVALRLSGDNLGREDSIVSTIQIAGKFPKALVFDVQSILQAPGGAAMLETELRSLLADSRICKVMHDVHDHTLALARLFRDPSSCSRIKSVVDMQLVQEKISGYPLYSFTECLICFGPFPEVSITFNMDEDVSVEWPLNDLMLQFVAEGVVRLRKAFMRAQETMAEEQMAICFRASQMKVDFAADIRRSGWRRMIFARENGGEDRTLGNTLASYELFVAPKLSSKPRQESQQGAPMTPTPQATLTTSETPSCTPLPSPSETPPPPIIGQRQDEKTRVAPIGGASVDEVVDAPPGDVEARESTEDVVEEAKAISSGDLGSICGSACPPGWSSAAKSQGMTELVQDEAGQSARGGDQETCGTRPSLSYEGNLRHEIVGSKSNQGKGNSDPEGEGRGFRDSGGLEDDDVLEMLKYLPNVFLEGILSGRDVDAISRLEEVVLDQGTRPRAIIQGRGKVYLCDDKDVLVTRYHISCVVGRLEREGLLVADDRTGFDGLLHRVGVIRDKNGTIYGVTIRVGRFTKGCAEVVADIIFDADRGNRRYRAPSILVLGRHGSGKTTLVRDMCRKLSATESVVIVDTRNDIGGEGIVPHREAIGDSRRVMIPCETMQHRVMYQALRNHSPRTLAVDEISSEEDVEACGRIISRGVRVIAGAVGDLPSILDSPVLGMALGGLMPVESSIDIKKEQRAHKPVFDVVIELEGGDQPTWSVVTRVATVVDELLEKGYVRKPEIRAPFPSVQLVPGKEGTTYRGFLLKVAQDLSDIWRW